LEFADFRPYQPGDDFRLVDWTVFARHRKLVTKVYSKEVESPLYILLDPSRSMAQGKPDKLRFSVRLSAALAAVAFRSYDRFSLYPLRAPSEPGLPPRRGRGHLGAVFRVLSELSPSGTIDLNAALTGWAEKGREPGLCVVASDFLCEDGWEEGLFALRHGRHEVVAAQVLAREDLDPPLLGEVRLLDLETRRGRSLVLGPGAWRAYQESLRAWQRKLSDACLELGIDHFLFRADSSPVEAALTLLGRRRG
jgi:uncharacterized protein (DUF58 family)